MDELIEKLRSVKWDVIADGDRMPGDPTRECVFVDMRPDEFEALLREAAAALEAAREACWQPIETAPNEAWFLVHSDRGWIGLARRSDPDYAPDEGWFEDEHTEFLDPEGLTHWHPLPAPPAIDQAQ